MTADTVGGVWQYATDLAAALRTMEIEVTLAVLGPAANAEQRAEADAAGATLIDTGLPLDWLCADARPVLAAGRALTALARDGAFDLIHLNSPSLLAAGPMPVPVLAVDHGGIGTWWQAAHGARPDEAYQWLDEMIRTGLLAADAVVAPSLHYAEALARHHRLPTVPLAIHNGRAPVAAADMAPDTAPVFTAGRLWDPVKNTALLDRVAGRLPVAFEAAGALTGPHGEVVTCQHLVTPGPLPAGAIAARLARRPVFVSAARFEPFGLAVLEAAQAGCPLVLSGLGTFRELWTGAALIVPDQDEAAYAAAIERVLNDEALRVHLGEAARIRSQRYTPAATAASVAAIYTGLLGDPHKVAA
jgi:glycosyltransferase involved in cell wall biosynthesis